MPLLANFELEAIEKGKAEGIEIGQSRGIEIGEMKGKSEIVLRMHGKGLSLDEIADLTGLSPAQIAAIVNNSK
jgi:predicted transposase/invertase (TIGR01784 family)